jgi:hypothetical protein
MAVGQLREAFARLPKDAVVVMDNGGGLSRVALGAATSGVNDV